MKKIIISLFFVLLFSGCVIVQAKSGDIAGKYYSTDIVTTLDGAEIDAINIGGQTLISAEDMRYFGYSVIWNVYERTLRIHFLDGIHADLLPQAKKYDHPSGTVLGNYYETDIVTYLENIPITAYNIGGRTYIHAEQMREFGYKVIWNAEKRTLTVTSPLMAGYHYGIRLTYGKEQTTEAMGNFSVTLKKGEILQSGDIGYFDMLLSADGLCYVFTLSFYQNAGLFYSSQIINMLDFLSSESYEGVKLCDPADKYGDISKVLKISVNGHDAKEIEISQGAGNGHRDWRISVRGLPAYTQDELNEVVISFKQDGQGQV